MKCLMSHCRGQVVMIEDTTRHSQRFYIKAIEDESGKRRKRRCISTIAYPLKPATPPLCYFHLKRWTGLFSAKFPLAKNDPLETQAQTEQKMMAQQEPQLRKYLEQ